MSLTIPVAEIVRESSSPLLAAHESWPRVRLGEVAQVLNGFAFKSSEFSKTQGVPLIRIRDLTNDSTTTRFAGEFDDRYLVQPGELLVGMDGEFNSRCWTGPPALLNQRVCKITPDENRLKLGFLARLLPGYLNAVYDVTSSTTVTHLSSRDIQDLPIPIPPTDQQLLMLKLLDESETQIAAVGSHLSRGSWLVDQLRLAVLARAFTRKLTVNWRSSQTELEPANQLIERTPAPAQGVGGRPPSPATIPGDFALAVGKPDLPAPPEWEWVPLTRIARLESGHTPSRSRPGYWGGTIPWVQLRDARVHHGKTILDTEDHVTQEGIENSAARVLPAGTVCLSRTASVGNVVILGREMATSQDFVNWTCTDAIDSKWLMYLLLAEEASLKHQFAKGTTHNTIYIPEVKAFHVCLPPIAEQKEAVRLIEAYMKIVEIVESQIRAANESIVHLPDAFFAKALRGDLASATSRVGTADSENDDELVA